MPSDNPADGALGRVGGVGRGPRAAGPRDAALPARRPRIDTVLWWGWSL